jgi:D-glycero-D-manno-heptose 1,7-bisphosphate phosphatase
LKDRPLFSFEYAKLWTALVLPANPNPIPSYRYQTGNRWCIKLPFNPMLPHLPYPLHIFDIDGTLCQLDSTQLMPGRLQTLKQLSAQGSQIAIATNQGGVGYRLYRQQHNKPVDTYPTEQEVLDRIAAIVQNIGRPIPYKIAFSYYIKHHKSWTPVPPGREQDPFWSTNYRKPNGGMLLDHMAELGFSADQTIYIGDRPEDEAAAQTAGCHFAWEHDFFPQAP